jgi:hypothetical protein
MTGKRQYTDMLIIEVTVNTDQYSEFVLLATLRCRQMLMVSTSTFTVPGGGSGTTGGSGTSSIPAQNQAEPSSTAAPINNGTVPLTDASTYNGAGTPPSVTRSYLQGGGDLSPQQLQALKDQGLIPC